jgi:hypothetical protein
VSKLAIVGMICFASFGDGQPLFAVGRISDPRYVRGLSTSAGVLNAGRRTLSGSASASVNERDFRIDTPRETAVVVATPLPPSELRLASRDRLRMTRTAPTLSS